VDCVWLPSDIRDLLEPGPSYIDSQPVIGLWPVAAAEVIENMLAQDGNYAVRAFAELIGARAVTSALVLANINTLGDLNIVSATIRDQP
jgi:molybdopterin-guanine dinucleotide biosynthesis protein A